MTVLGEESEQPLARRDLNLRRAQTRPVPPGLTFWRLYLVEMRPYLMFLSVVTGVAGMAFAPDVSIPDLLILTTLFFLAYGFGQALTDCFQTDTDALSAPYRPLAQGRLRQRDVLIVSLAGLITGGAILTIYNPLNLALVGAGVAGLATYTWFKRHWWGGPFYNAWIVADLCLIGYTSGLGSSGASPQWSAELLTGLVTVLFAYANFVLAGYFKDVSADRATGYRTLPVVFGLPLASFASDALAVLALLSCGTTLNLVLPSGFGAAQLLALLCIAGAAAWTALGQTRLHKVTSESEAHRAIAPTVHAYVLILCAITVALQPGWALLLGALYGGFFVALSRRPMQEQI